MEAKFKYHWFSKADIDAYFGLLFDGFSKVLAAVGIMIFGFGLPTEIVLGRIVPGLALGTLFGNLWYAHEAKKLAEKELRQDVTAQPYGVGAGQVFGWLFLIIGPVFWDSGNAVLAWQVGIAACFTGGFIEIIGAFIGKKILEYSPRASILGNLAAGAIIWLALISILNIYDKPYIALLPLFIVIFAFLGKVKMPFNLPAGLVAIIVGTIIAWSTGSMDAAKVSESFSQVKFYSPKLSIADVFIGMKAMVKYLPVIIPLQLTNFLTTLQGLESAEVAGDKYPVKSSMIMDGIGTILGSIFGNPFPTTVYWGHPSWKEIGARSGYSILNGLTYLILALTGLTGIISAVIPFQAVMPILLFVGIVCAGQAFNECKKSHAVAILFGFLPLIAQYLETAVNAALTAVDTNMATVGIEAFTKASFPIQGVLSLSQGAFLSGLLLTAMVALIIDREYIMATVFSFISAFSAFVGLIHAPEIGFASPNGIPFAIIYAVVGLICLVLKYTVTAPNEINQNI